MLEEETFNVSLPQILEMIFLDIHIYIAVFCAGDQEFCDKESTTGDTHDDLGQPPIVFGKKFVLLTSWGSFHEQLFGILRKN